VAGAFGDHGRVGDFGIATGLPKIMRWRAALNERPSVRAAVSPDYPDLLWAFLAARGSHLSRLMVGEPREDAGIAA